MHSVFQILKVYVRRQQHFYSVPECLATFGCNKLWIWNSISNVFRILNVYIHGCQEHSFYAPHSCHTLTPMSSEFGNLSLDGAVVTSHMNPQLIFSSYVSFRPHVHSYIHVHPHPPAAMNTAHLHVRRPQFTSGTCNHDCHLY